MFNRSINKVILVGNLGKDPEMRRIVNGGTVANLVLATTMSWKDKHTGQWREKTEWHRLTIFGALGDMCVKYLTKGNKIYIEGRLETQKWQDKNTGHDKFSTSIIVADLQLLESQHKAGNIQQESTRLNDNSQMPMTSSPGYLSDQIDYANNVSPITSWGTKPQNDDSASTSFSDDIPF